jgi:hypothetical protein
MRALLIRSIKINTVLVLVIASICLMQAKFSFCVGILVGAAWSTLNFILTINLLEMALLNKPKDKLLLLLLIKFPLLYLLGFYILINKFFPVLSLLLGISTILLVLGVLSICMKHKKPGMNCQI